MDIDVNTVRHVARIARLDLTDTEIAMFVPQLSEVLDAFSKLSEIDTSGVEPSFQPVPLKNHWREDDIEPSLSQKEALENSRNTSDGFFKGPSAV